MQTGTISFCDKQSLNIKSNDTKKVFNDKLNDYGIKILQKHFEKFDDNSFNNNKFIFYTVRNNNDECSKICKNTHGEYWSSGIL